MAASGEKPMAVDTPPRVYAHAPMRTVYDLALFERLNEEWRERRRPRTEWREHGTPASRPQVAASEVYAGSDRAVRRAAGALVHAMGDLSFKGAEVLDLGCGRGWSSAFLRDYAEATRVVGVDIKRYSDWEQLRQPGSLEFHVADLSRDSSPVAFGTLDAVFSTVVLEHVHRPLQMLRQLRRLLRDGGHAWLRFNLHAGASASHRYREVFFPWPHLLFDDEVGRQFYEKWHGRKWTFSWVNRMSVATYLLAASEVGFEVVTVRRDVPAIDIPFYLRFEDRLGRYTALDLETNFMTLVLRATWAAHPPPQLDYLERQEALDRAVDAERAASADACELSDSASRGAG